MKKIFQALLTMTAAALTPVITSCDSFVYDDQGDCSVIYRVPFTYTMNILDVDAFRKQVTSVTLYVFREDGSLALVKTESGSPLATPGYAMDIELKPGKYSMLAWCTGEPCCSPASDATPFTIGGNGNPAVITDLSATLPLDGSAPNLYCDKDIVPLFHGYMPEIELGKDDYGIITLPAINLTKDTKLVDVIIENMEGYTIQPSDFSYRIEADNSQMAWNNDLEGSKSFSYLPWNVEALKSDRSETKAEADNSGMSGVLAESTTGRLIIDRSPRIIVTRTRDNKDIISINLIDQLLKIRGSYQKVFPAQEFLDRLDYISMTFIVDVDHNWYTAAGININGWTVVPDAYVSF